MKNVIYGLGAFFLNNMPLWTDIIKDTVAFCDSDEQLRAKYRSIIGLPVIAPEEILDKISEGGMVYVTSERYCDEILRDLTAKYNIPAKCVACVRLPNEDLLIKIQDFIDSVAYGPSVAINEKAFESAILLQDRQTALKYMPQNAVCAEIGVAYGDFSEQILKIMKPQKFYACDLFSEEHPYKWNRDWFERDNMTHLQWYRNRFKNEIALEQVETRQGLSWNVLSGFPDDYFDYAYLDAAHNYESIMKDLSILPSKVKHGGFIQFNDYTMGDSVRFLRYGVISAVNQFVDSGNHKVRYFCLQLNGYHDIVIQIYKN